MFEKPVKAIPDGMHSLTPYLVCRDATAAIAFYKEAFGATESSRLANAGGKILNAQLRIGDSLMMVMDEFLEFGALGPHSLKGSPVTIHLQVQNVDQTFGHAVQSGAVVKKPLTDEFWGDRIGVLQDPFGHYWSVGTHVRDVSESERQASGAHVMGQGAD